MSRQYENFNRLIRININNRREEIRGRSATVSLPHVLLV
jgi:hypothetical protein